MSWRANEEKGDKHLLAGILHLGAEKVKLMLQWEIADRGQTALAVETAPRQVRKG